MKTKTIIYCLFGLLLLMGCKDEPQYTRFENHTISACGIADPLNNLPWLKAYCIEYYNYYEADISIYKNDQSGDNFIVITNLTKSGSNLFGMSTIYNCEGVQLITSRSYGTELDAYYAFFQENKLVASIWSVKEIIKN